jgi:hypothetical protein
LTVDKHAASFPGNSVRRGWVVLGFGLVALAVGVAIALARHDIRQKPLGPGAAAQRDRYDRLITQAATSPVHYDVSLVQFPLGDLDVVRDSGGADPYQIVDTDITERIRSGTPSLQPEFATLPHTPAFDDFVRQVRSGRLRQVGNDVVALLLTQRTAGTPREIRLTVDRLSIAKGAYAYVLDPTDVSQRAEFTRHLETISWKPDDKTAGALIPLYISHILREPHAKGYYFFAVGGFLTGPAFSPRRVVIVQPDGRTTELAMKDVSGGPLALNTHQG